jgi:lipopolysaccharide/colanic/teichoic acid biosynthesis glycosyltransferase
MEKIDKHDDRLIPGAKFLRATGLDELPQLINVIKGEMSLVGPRPCLKYEFEYFAKSQRRRFDVLPGLTGLWQINGKNKTTFQKMASLDVAYAKHHNFLMDLRIMASTFRVLYSQLMEKC